MRSRVILLTGSSPPDPCGVGDYTTELASALEKANQPLELICHRSWNASGTAEIIRRLRMDSDSLVHIQYPTAGYKYSLGPQFCALATASIVTIHEFSAAHVLRKISLFPFTLRAPSLVMTTHFEARSFLRSVPWARSRLHVIPIGSNIPVSVHEPPIGVSRIVYFGLITPNKGLESFIEFARLLRANHHRGEVAVIGRVVPRHDEYARRLMEASHPHGVVWMLDRDSDEVSHLLSQSAICYLPFPDGASDRRSSLKTACTLGLACITTKGDDTPAELAQAVQFASTPMEAAKTAMHLLAEEGERVRRSHGARKYAEQFTWDRIAEAHIRLYTEVAASRRKKTR